MFCIKCGSALPESASFCPNCAAPVNAQIRQQPQQQPAWPRPQTEKVTDWLIPSIIAAVVSFMSCGILGGISGGAAIYFASQANSLMSKGDIENARKNADHAKFMFWLTVGLWLFGIILAVIIYVLYFFILVLNAVTTA